MVVDHEGREFPYIKDMCEAWGVNESTYNGRRARGMSLKEALTKPVMATRPESTAVRDHNGREFPSKRAMCEAWGVSYEVFNSRYNVYGWTLKDSLTKPTRSRARVAVDHEGREFPSVKAMCEHWGLSYDLFWQRRAAGWDLKRALETPPDQEKAPRSRQWRQATDGNDVVATKAEFRAVREGIGVSTTMLAQRMGVRERAVRTWERPGKHGADASGRAVLPPPEAWDILEDAWAEQHESVDREFARLKAKDPQLVEPVKLGYWCNAGHFERYRKVDGVWGGEAWRVENANARVLAAAIEVCGGRVEWYAFAS